MENNQLNSPKVFCNKEHGKDSELNGNNTHYNTSIETPKKESVKKTIDDYRIDFSKEIEKPPTCLKMIQDGREIPICTLGNFSLIIGKAKSKKTFFATMLMASMLSDEIFNDMYISELPNDKKKVVLFDTEQSEYHVQKVARRVLRQLNGDNIPNFEVYHLRTAGTQERLKLIKEYIYSHSDIGFIVIDGIRDLITGINDEAESNMIKDELLKWTDERKIHIVTILHQNKNDENARGHVGSELVNKSETVISVKKDPQNKNISIVESKDNRDINFEDFAFEIDDTGLPQISNGWSNTNNGKSKIIIPENINMDKHREVLANIFSGNNKQYNYLDFCKEIKTAFAEYEISFGDNKAKDFVKYYKKKGFVIDAKTGTHTMYKLTPAINYDLEV